MLLSNKYLIIIQARMGSNRLPGKSFVEIGGKPMIAHLLESLLTFYSKDDIVLVTSIDPKNEILTSYCSSHGIYSFQGEEENVASRYMEVLKLKRGYDYFFRICGDTPLYDARILKKGQGIIAQKENLDWVSSMPNKGYPQGQNLEMININTFMNYYDHFLTKDHFEHVTKFFYQNANKFLYSTVNFDYEGYTYDKYKFSVDDETDFERISNIFKKMKRPPHSYSLSEMCDIYNTLT